jgi:hypothetical protein
MAAIETFAIIAEVADLVSAMLLGGKEELKVTSCNECQLVNEGVGSNVALPWNS